MNNENILTDIVVTKNVTVDNGIELDKNTFFSMNKWEFGFYFLKTLEEG